MKPRFGLDDPVPTFAGSLADRNTTEAELVDLDETEEHGPRLEDGPLALIWLPRSASSKSFPLSPGKYRVGRARSRVLPPLDLEIEDEAVSRVHATLDVLEGGKVLVEDKKSTNGVRVNNVRITQATELRPGDVLMVGNTRLRLVGRP
jgi:pSer/pThr/pTyr-binding forkhead associated (FHA) protein